MWGMTASDVFLVYDGFEEHIFHGFFWCGCTLDVWIHCLSTITEYNVDMDLKGWLKSGIDEHVVNIMVILLHVWYSHNKCVF